MKLVGITTRLDNNVYKVNESIIEKLKKYDIMPILIVPGFENNLTSILDKCSGFIIPGGVTWHEADEIIIKYALKNDIPLLGICAGMQALANIHNFDKDILSDQTIPIGNDSHYSQNEYAHNIQVVSPFLENILQDKFIRVNSRHKFKVAKEDYFVVDAYSDDGLIEAIHIPNKKFILGVQWHPEDLRDEYSERLFAEFIKNCHG